MKYEEYEIKDNSFEYLDKKYDCSYAIKRDIKLIIQEAETSHKDAFNKLYNRDSLTPQKVRLFLDDRQEPIYGMIIYTINYKNQNVKRTACGNYYPVINWLDTLELMPHLFQGSICW
jgi:hypothetical protein